MSSFCLYLVPQNFSFSDFLALLRLDIELILPLSANTPLTILLRVGSFAGGSLAAAASF